MPVERHIWRVGQLGKEPILAGLVNEGADLAVNDQIGAESVADIFPGVDDGDALALG